QDLAESFGYPFQAHEVSSQTGYILSLHRIPYGIKRKQSNNTKRPVALFQHGLVSASDMWMFQGPNVNLPYILADAGYDVWISNMRGNVYSKAHKVLNPDKDPTFWDFTLHEVAYYDLPAIIDYILNITNHSNLYFLGHSIGSTVGMILCTLRPEYNSKIKLHLSLAPLVYVTHAITVSHKIFMLPTVPMIQTALANQIYNMFPRRPFFAKLMQMLCNDGTPLQQLCISTVFLLVGADYSQFDTKCIPDMTTYFPAGTSTYLIRHTLQIYLNGTLSALDYGNNEENFKKYNQTDPPHYNLSTVTHPISLHYGNGDLLVTEQDIDYIEKELPNPVGKFPVPHSDFNHIDFVWGIDAKKLIYDRIIVIMDKYR
ncbi:lipase 1-like, partial [Anoplophora glabripennis]|uniref:lipase 1-like n=1 Tax=Anoplophora glabripennis TaxID=217634 RepID=UPI000C7952B0